MKLPAEEGMEEAAKTPKLLTDEEHRCMNAPELLSQDTLRMQTLLYMSPLLGM